MSLRDIAQHIRRNPLPQRSFSVQRAIAPASVEGNGGNGGNGDAVLPKRSDIIGDVELPARSPSMYGGTSIKRIAEQYEGRKGIYFGGGDFEGELCWEKCACLKKSGNRNFCTKYVSLCAQDNCPKKNIEVNGD